MLYKCKDFSVILAKNVYCEAGCEGVYDVNPPDHSLFRVKVSTTQYHNKNGSNEWSHSYTRYSRDIPAHFDQGIMDAINALVVKLESEMNVEKLVNEVFSDFTKIVRNRMDEVLEKKEIYK